MQLERAQRIVETVERIEAQRVEWRGQGGKGREKEQVRKWCGELEEPIGVRTYYRYRQQYDIDPLLGGRGRERCSPHQRRAPWAKRNQRIPKNASSKQ